VQGFLAALTVIGVVTVITLAGRSAATWWAVAALGTEYAVFLFGRHTDFRAPTELVHWSLKARSSVRIETGMNLRHIDLGMPWLSSLALGLLIVAAGAIGVHGGLPLAIVGVLGPCPRCYRPISACRKPLKSPLVR
jgi:hypothetical protein